MSVRRQLLWQCWRTVPGVSSPQKLPSVPRADEVSAGTVTFGTPTLGGRRTRRRGIELQAALLEAAWDELASVGYANFTMESAARRARTGVAVLYRRWANKDELVMAAFKHYRDAHPVTGEDTGSLRGDLVSVMKSMGQQSTSFFAVAFGAAFAGLLASRGLTIEQFRKQILDPDRTDYLHGVYQRARDRGELGIAEIPPAVLSLPIELVRHDMLLNPEPISDERISSILDDIVLPLLLQDRSSSPSRQ